MSEKKQGHIKSALELAMERLEKKGGKRVSLTAEQKLALQDIENDLTARIAEVEILTRQGIETARAGGDAEKVEVLEEHWTRESGRLRREAERKKEKVRKGETRGKGNQK
jgi:hypothetical protein